MNCMNCGNTLAPNVKFCPKCGTPISQPADYAPPNYSPPEYTPPAINQVRTSYAPPGGPPQGSWGAHAPRAASPPRRKSRAGKILLVLFVSLVLLAAGASFAVYYGFRRVASSVKSSEAYTVAERELRASPLAAERLGEIKGTGFPIGSYSVEGDAGSAAYTMSVEGTKDSAQYVVTMSREGGRWRVSTAFLRMNGGEIVNLTGPGEGGVEDVITVEPPRPPQGVKGNLNAGGARGPAPISGGVLNGKAVSKPEPTYPAIAKAARASGTVVVQVLVDEKGNVISASAVSGHPLLQASAVAAARQAKLSPTLLSGKPVRVSGVLTYTFAAAASSQ